MTEGIGLSEEEKKEAKRCFKEEKSKGEKTENAFLRCKNRLASKLKDPKKTEILDLTADAYTCLNNTHMLSCIRNASKNLKYPESARIVESITAAFNGAKEINIKLVNTPFSGKARLITYKVDEEHSNACSFNKRTEPTKTDAPCGLGGAIDRAVMDAKKEAERKAEEAARISLLDNGYSNPEIDEIERRLIKCMDNINECLEIQGLSPQKMGHLKSAVKKYKDVRQRLYYEKMEQINNLKEVSLEGSREERTIDLDKGILISLSPNSVYILILEKG